MTRLLLIARLAPGSHAKAADLLEVGPPFDPSRVGMTRHHAFLTGEEVVFLFEGPEVEWTVDDLVDHPIVAASLEPWTKLVVGSPRIAHELYRGSASRRRPARSSVVLAGLEQPVVERVADELRARVEAELLHDVRAVGLGGADRDEEQLRDLLVRVAEREQAEHLALAVGERVGRRRRARAPRRRRAARRARGWT